MTFVNPINIYIFITALTSAIDLIVLCMLFWKGGRSRPTMLWGSITGLLSLWCFSEVFIKSTPDFWTALIWFRPVLVAGGLIPPLLLNFSLEFPRRHPLIKKKMNRFLFYMLVYLPNIFLLLRAEYMSYFVTESSIPMTVWGNAFTRDFFIRLVA